MALMPSAYLNLYKGLILVWTSVESFDNFYLNLYKGLILAYSMLILLKSTTLTYIRD